jgi:hypothetical protein
MNRTTIVRLCLAYCVVLPLASAAFCVAQLAAGAERPDTALACVLGFAVSTLVAAVLLWGTTPREGLYLRLLPPTVARVHTMAVRDGVTPTEVIRRALAAYETYGPSAVPDDETPADDRLVRLRPAR